MGVVFALCRTVHFASEMLLFGAGAFRIALPPRLRSGDETFRRLFTVSAWVSLVTAVLWFFLTAANMAGTPAAITDLKTLHLVLLYTDFGTLWIWHLAIAIILVAVTMFVRRLGLLLVFLSALLLASLALTGHAAIGTGWQRMAHRIADAVHLLSAGIWLGGLVALLAILRSSTHDAALSALNRFSIVAAPAVLLVLVAGALNAVFIVADWNAFLASRYGILLLAKMTFAATMAVLALLNRMALMPRLAAGDRVSAQRMRLSVIGEIVLGAAVLTIVGVLGLTSP